MKKFCRCLFCIVTGFILLSATTFQNSIDGRLSTVGNKNNIMADQFKGAWMAQNGEQEHLLMFVDGYATHTTYSKSGKKFISTRGGTYTVNGNRVEIAYEFHTRDKEHVGQSRGYNIFVKDDVLTIKADDREVVYKRVDDGSAPLTGVWHITSRMQDGQLVPIHRSGTRKTIKILSGKHFQWAAIDPGTKSFMGTGGGTYEFTNGKYTEHIEFFSRDSSRVGASLSFDGKLEKGEWHHSGLSSRGEKIYEVWSRLAGN